MCGQNILKGDFSGTLYIVNLILWHTDDLRICKCSAVIHIKVTDETKRRKTEFRVQGRYSTRSEGELNMISTCHWEKEKKVIGKPEGCVTHRGVLVAGKEG